MSGRTNGGASARLHAAAAAALWVGLDQLVRRNLRGVWVRGELPAGGAVWATNHSSWWDFFAAAAALRATGRRDVGVLMDPANIGGRRFFAAAGAVGADRPRAVVDRLRGGQVVVVFPEGELRAPGPVGPLRPGARWFAEHAGVPLVPVATRVLLRGQQAPEAYLHVGAPDGDLAALVTGLDECLAAADPTGPVPGFTRLVPGVRSWNERFGGRMTTP